MAAKKDAVAENGAAAKKTTTVKKLGGAENVSVAVTEDKITLVISRKVKGHPSKSGKTIVVATSRGNQPIPDTDLKLGLNIYRPADAE